MACSETIPFSFSAGGMFAWRLMHSGIWVNINFHWKHVCNWVFSMKFDQIVAPGADRFALTNKPLSIFSFHLTWTGYQSISKEIVQQFIEEYFFSMLSWRQYRLQIFGIRYGKEWKYQHPNPYQSSIQEFRRFNILFEHWKYNMKVNWLLNVYNS